MSQQDFSPRLLRVVESPPSPLPWAVLVSLLLLLIIIVSWAFLGRLDIVAKGEGRLVPQTRLKIVQPLEGGRVAKVFVKEGELVKANQLLALMDDRLSLLDTNKLEHDLALTRLQLRRVTVEAVGQELVREENEDALIFERVHAQYMANVDAQNYAVTELQAELEKTEQELAAAQERSGMLLQTLPLYIEEEKAYLKLATAGYSNKLARIQHQRERIEVEKESMAQQYMAKSLQAEVMEVNSKLSRLRADYRKALYNEQVRYKSEIVAIEKDLAKQKYRNKLMRLVAPANGIVKDLTTHTEGSVIPSGTVLMTLIPSEEPLKAEVMVANKDVGFIKLGQIARLKMASYEFQRYGIIDATVELVSPDAAESTRNSASEARGEESNSQAYRVLLTLDKQFLERDERQFGLLAGMLVTAEIKLGTRSVMEYLISPIQKGLYEAGQER